MSDKAVVASDVCRSFGDLRVLDSLSFTVPDRGVFGFLGVNGAGKTTTIRILTGLLAADSGRIEIFGREPRQSQGRIGYLAQEPGFYAWMTATEYCAMTAELYGFSGRESLDRAERALKRVGLADAASRRVGGYSTGMKQRLGIAAATLHNPGLVILDEPVSSLDPVGRAEVLDLIRELGGQSAVLMSSHILADVERIADQVAIIHHGRIIVQDHTASLKEKYLLPLLEIEVEGDVSGLTSALSAAPFVRGVSLVGVDTAGVSLLRVTVTDVAAARDGIAAVIAGPAVRLHSLHSGSASLEDVFMGLVKAETEAVR
ncbi:MAG: ABC transporter ATP-binding protein [Candidatus Brocadiia bacterium]